MILLEPYWQILEQKPGLDGMFKQIEYCGRISHKSEDLITENSYIDFIKKMQKLQHFATFEHGTVYLVIEEDSNPYGTLWKDIVDFYVKNPYSKVNHYDWSYYITTNYRVICENDREADLVAYWSEPTEHHEKRHTVIFTCDIGVSREYNRHRVNSILEESTRYCNYTKEKHGSSLNVIVPIWLREDYRDKLNEYLNKDLKTYCYLISDDREDEFKDIDYWMFSNKCAEFCYNKLINECKWAPQQARTILPLDTKTTLAHTAFDSDWEHFFDLRALGTTGAPHPSAKELAEPLMNFFEKNNYI
jgi:thymidylate synthase (FAD)